MNNEQVRAAALEEAVQAAQECDVATMKWAGQTLDDGVQTKSDIVAAIRALASSAAPERSGVSTCACGHPVTKCDPRNSFVCKIPERSGKLADDIRPAAWTRQDLLNEIGKLESVIELGNRNTQMWKDRAPEADSSSAAPSDLEIRVRKVLEGVHIETGRTEEFECVVANIVAAIAAPAPAGEGAWKALADKAIAVLCRHIVPDGISDKEALSELYGIFDGPEYRAALDAPAPTGESLSAIPTWQEMAHADGVQVYDSATASIYMGKEISAYRDRAALATPRQTSGEAQVWIPVTERMPDDYREVYAKNVDGQFRIARRSKKSGGCWQLACFGVGEKSLWPDKEVTHWCILSDFATPRQTEDGSGWSAAGWTIERRPGGRISATHINHGFFAVEEEDDNVRASVTWLLLNDLLAAAPTPPAPL